MGAFAVALLALFAVVATPGAGIAQEPAQESAQKSAQKSVQKPVLKIGVLAKRGVAKAIQQWGPTADFLSRKIEGYKFELVPLGFEEVTPKVAGGDVDFLLVNPSIYVEMETLYGVSRLSTLRNLGPDGRALTIFGGVILTKAVRNDIQSVADLKKVSSFMAVKENSLGGFQVAWFELKKNGIDPYSDFNDLIFRSKHDSVVFAVINGEVDAGTVRTDTLERMAAEGKINMDDVKVIGSGYGEGAQTFPYKISTMLVPEWPMAKLAHTSDDIAQEVAIALLEMRADDPAAIAGKNAGWTVPLNYQPIRNLMQELRIGPFRDLGRLSLRKFFVEYWRWVLIFTVTFASLVSLLLYILKINGKLKASETILKVEVEERHNAEKALAEHGKELQAQIKSHTEALEHLEKIRKYHDLTSLLITTLNPKGLLRKGLDRVVELSGSAIGGIYLLDEKEQKVRPYVFHGVSVASMDSVGLHDSLPAQVVADKKLRHIKEMPGDCGLKINFGFDEGCPKELLMLPMLSKDRALGVIILGTLTGYAEEDIQVLTHMSNQISIMLENALSNEEMEELVDNKESLNEQLAYEIHVKDKFFSIISHDLKSPFTALLGMSELMATSAESYSKDKIVKYAKNVNEAGKQIFDLLQNLLEWSRLQMEGNTFKPKTILLQEQARKSIEILTPMALEKDITLTNRIEKTAAFADPDMVRTVIRNLVANALKFTPSGGSVELSSDNNGNRVQITVSDTGVGMTAKQSEIIFSLDRRTSTTGTAGEKGSGLGLPLCKELVERNAGFIWVESAPEEGSKFHFSLPIGPEAN